MTTDDVLHEEQQALEAARVLALLDASRHSLAALAAAVDLASQRHAELVALYVEDLDLLKCAAFPFSCEIGAQSGLSRPLTHDSLEASIARQLQRVNQALTGAVAGRSLRHRLEVSRGQVAATALAMAEPGDVLVLGKTGLSERWGSRLGSTSRRLILEAPCTVLLWDERHPYRRGPLRWLETPPEGATPLATGTPVIADWLAALFDGIAPLPVQHAGELERMLARADAGGLLLQRGELDVLLKEDPELLARVPLPILVVT
ncbi:universal stress protein [Billgrantia kenyensis]|uniref:Universal stress protein n=1 Tax=Billgrantia kenyensis TaxID=321266 RepID=A0A7V9W0S9_9GAMM|nr:universal stress protein [Halomonas kenyensis]MBA2778955.1 universal stress protein [Halomonas kenyensis]MCG6662882.1 universal stress protein [Halomonas kenyensis]